MSDAIQTTSQESIEALLAYNASRLEQHKRLRCFELFTDGTLEAPEKREMMLACLQVFARHFQTMLFMRQAQCADDRYGVLFLGHLREEIGHDDVLRKDRGRSDEVWDPVVEGAAAWFISRMSILDNIEKLAIIHLVLESSGAHMGAITRKTMRQFGSANYFELHDELDQSHVTVALEPVRRQPPETIARLRVVLEQAWQMLDTWVSRVELLVTGGAKAELYTPELR
ncbi:Hypothetical protein A7982_09808 [Minicystis rosea]|nr:Hypothetical protein A7982_09808 [Minicystis rosea]